MVSLSEPKAFLWGLILVVSTGVAVPGLNASTDKVADGFQPYADLLEQHLTEKRTPEEGLVSAFDYDAAREDPRTRERLQKQVEWLRGFDPERLDGRQESVAFWINTYNFFMIYHLLENPVDGQIVDSVWDYGGRYNPLTNNVFQRKLFTVGGSKYSLDQIEKGILLGDEYEDRGWKDARVHFAVNCASVGCPPLRQQIYTASNLERLLTENTRLALNTPRHLQVEQDRLKLSEVFFWYRQDYVEEEGSVHEFIREYGDEEIRRAVDGTEKLVKIPYDWSLNRPENFPGLD